MAKKTAKVTSTTKRTSPRKKKKESLSLHPNNQDVTTRSAPRPILTIQTWDGRSLMTMMAPLVANE